MAEYTVKTSSKFILFYEDENAEIDPDALLQKIADEKTQQFKEKVKKPKADKAEKLKSKVEATKPEPVATKVAKKDIVNENQPLKSPDKKFNAQKQDGRPPRFANKRGGADQQNKENITSSTEEWGNSGNDWGTSGASASNDKAPEDWTTSSNLQKSSNQPRGGSVANRRGGGFGEFNGPRVPRNFEGRGEFRGRGRGSFNRGGFQSTESGVEGEKNSSDFADDALKSDEHQNFGSRGGYKGNRGGYRRDDEGGDFRPRGRGRGRGRSHIEESGLGTGTNVGTSEDWGTGETVEAMAPTSDTFDQQNLNFGRSGRRNFGGGFRGGRGGRGSSYGRGREFDRHSGSDKTGVKAVDRKDGAGTGNWGTAEDDLKAESDALGFENTEPATNWDADESHDDSKDDKQDGTKSAASEITLMTLEEYKAKKKLEAAAMEQLRSQTVNTRTVNDGFKDDAFKNMYEYRKTKEDSEADESDEEEEIEENSTNKSGQNKEVLFDFKFNDNDRRGGGPGSGGFRGGRGGGFGRAGRGGNFKGGRGGTRGRDIGEGGHNLPAANIRLDDETDFPTLKGH